MSDELDWDDISLRKKQLLGTSDWTQLPDAGLTDDCVHEWREWRSKVRNITQKKYKDRIPATLALQTLRNNQPETKFGKPSPSVYKREGGVYTRQELTEAIREVIEDYDLVPRTEGNVYTQQEINKLFKEAIEDYDLSYKGEFKDTSIKPSLGHATDIKAGKRLGVSELDAVYRQKLLSASPSYEKTHLYWERLNQALDYRSKTGMDYHPLLETISESLDRSVEDVAAEIVKKHLNMIKDFEKIESDYLSALQTIREADTLETIREAVEKFSGH